MHSKQIVFLATLAVGIRATVIPEALQRRDTCVNMGSTSCSTSGSAGNFACAASDVQILANFLIDAGTAEQKITSPQAVFMAAVNGCSAIGYNNGASCVTSSYARDVGYAIQNNLINGCCQDQGICGGGFTTAGGNGYFGIYVSTANGAGV